MEAELGVPFLQKFDAFGAEEGGGGGRWGKGAVAAEADGEGEELVEVGDEKGAEELRSAKELVDDEEGEVADVGVGAADMGREGSDGGADLEVGGAGGGLDRLEEAGVDLVRRRVRRLVDEGRG